jgi:folylpolyglutamate synthase/dihydropteroate synthase
MSANIPAEPATCLAEALARIKQTALPNTPVIICGSLYLAGQVLEENQTLPD